MMNRGQLLKHFPPFNSFIIFLILIRIFMLLRFGIYSDEKIYEDVLWNDNFHHFEAGIIVVAVFLPLYMLSNMASRKYYCLLSLLFGLSLIIEEHAVILYHLKIPHLHYLTVSENLVFGFFILICVVLKSTRWKSWHPRE